jgi:hypothetical protein
MAQTFDEVLAEARTLAGILNQGSEPTGARTWRTDGAATVHHLIIAAKAVAEDEAEARATVHRLTGELAGEQGAVVALGDEIILLRADLEDARAQLAAAIMRNGAHHP